MFPFGFKSKAKAPDQHFYTTFSTDLGATISAGHGGDANRRSDANRTAHLNAKQTRTCLQSRWDVMCFQHPRATNEQHRCSTKSSSLLPSGTNLWAKDEDLSTPGTFVISAGMKKCSHIYLFFWLQLSTSPKQNPRQRTDISPGKVSQNNRI